MGHFAHEDELYNVATAKFYSSPRPVGLRPAGRVLSLSVDGHEKPAFGVGCRGPPSSLNFQKCKDSDRKVVNGNQRYKSSKYRKI